MTIKLTYFNVRGLTGLSYFILIGGEYEDFRYPLDVIDMSTYRMTDEVDKDKADGNLLSQCKFHFEVDGVDPQSKTIEGHTSTTI